jgi:hypothetical protein
MALKTSLDITTAFVAPVTQSFLPVMDIYGSIVGALGITSTTFSGSETSVSAGGVTVTLNRYTRPERGTLSGVANPTVKQMMVVIIPQERMYLQEWLGWSSFLALKDFGIYRTVRSGIGAEVSESIGVLFNLLFNMAKTLTFPSGTTTPPAAANGALAWAANIPGTDHINVFFDTNWVNLFNATKGGNQDPMRLDVVSNPAGVPLKALLVGATDSSASQTAFCNTVRILKYGTVPAGSYTFNFKVTDTTNNSTPVTLTLTIS